MVLTKMKSNKNFVRSVLADSAVHEIGGEARIIYQ